MVRAVSKIASGKIIISDFVPDGVDDKSAIEDKEAEIEDLLRELEQIEKFNPHHVPAGSPEGGQFTSSPGGFVTIFDRDDWRFNRLGRTTTIGVIKHGDVQFRLDVDPEAMEWISISGEAISDDAEAVFDEEIQLYVKEIDAVMAEVNSEHLENLGFILLTRNTDDQKRTGAGSYKAAMSDGFAVGNSEIRIDVSKAALSDVDNIRTGMNFGYALKHEIGHNTWDNYLNASKRMQFGEMVGFSRSELLGSKDIMGRLASTTREIVKDTSNYGAQSVSESWAETYTIMDWSAGEFDFGSPYSVVTVRPAYRLLDNEDRISAQNLESMSGW